MARALSCAATTIMVWTFSFPLYIDVVVALVLLVLYFRASARDLILLACSTCAGAIVLVPVTKIMAGTGALSVFYREHEQYARPDQTYQTHVNAVVRQPHGDNLAID